MRTRQHHTLRLLAAAGAVGACSTLTGPKRVAEPALLIFYGDTARILAPDTVARGQPFEVRFRTFAGGCTREVARTDVQVAPGMIELRPYNWRRGAAYCTADLLYLEHRAEVRVAEAGVVTLRVRGEQRGASTGSRNVPVELTRPLVVR